MFAIIRSVIAPVLSLIFLTVGNGLFTTFVSLRLNIDGESTQMIGYITAAFFTGIVLGSIRIHRTIERIGHIRSFTSLAGLICASTMLQAIFLNPWVWLVLRFFSGFFLSGLIITIESWLLAQSTSSTKGKVLSIYMISYYGSLVGGQFLLNVASPSSLIPFAMTVIGCALSVVPVSMTRSAAPIMQEPSYLSVWKLLKISPVGVLGSIISGLILGAIYGLLPIFAKVMYTSVSDVALIMGVTIFGGLILQWPLGHLSDHVDRRKVILLTSIISSLLSIAIALLNGYSSIGTIILCAIFGGFGFTIYPLSICHASDKLDYKDLVSATAALNLSYGVGAIFGPIAGSFTMKALDVEGLFYFIAFCTAVMGLYTIYRIVKRTPINPDDKSPYRNIPRTSPLAGEFDPTLEEKKEEEEEKSQSSGSSSSSS